MKYRHVLKQCHSVSTHVRNVCHAVLIHVHSVLHLLEVYHFLFSGDSIGLVFVATIKILSRSYIIICFAATGALRFYFLGKIQYFAYKN